MPPICLASTSSYRRELLARLHLAFECLDPDIDEAAVTAASPALLAAELARRKAAAGAARRPEALVIGADQVAVCGGRVLGKPGGAAAARAQLRHCAGREVLFHSAVALLNAPAGRWRERTVDTRVRFRPLAEAEIEGYLSLEPAFDCAGSAKIEALGIALLESVQGPDPTAIVGLPLIALAAMLRAEGLAIPPAPAAPTPP